MSKTINIILLCCVAIVLGTLFTVTQLMAGEKPPPKFIDKYQTRISYNEITVGGLQKRYFRDDKGCVEKAEALNDPAKCTGSECRKHLETCREKGKCLKPQWIKGIEPRTWPKIWGEYLVGAGSTIGESGSNICREWSFTVAGSPGWHCDYVGGRPVCSCIGYYFPPPWDLCCQPSGCRTRP